MKQPRISDFDPHAKEKALKSPMDDFPTIQHQLPQKPADETRPTVPLVPLVPPVRGTGRRKIKQRHPFDIYQDQLDTLKQLALEERMRGGVGSMSAMVREAIDDLLAKRRNS